jgi:hypothetical protein
MDKTQIKKFIDDILAQAATGPSLTDANMIQKNSLSPALGRFIAERLHALVLEMGGEVSRDVTTEILNAKGLEGNQTEIGTFLLGLATRTRAQVAKMYARQTFIE